MWNTNLLGALGAANASAVTYLTPVVGVWPGINVLGESVPWNEPLGAVIVIAGIAGSQGRLEVPVRRAGPVTRCRHRMGKPRPRRSTDGINAIGPGAPPCLRPLLGRVDLAVHRRHRRPRHKP